MSNEQAATCPATLDIDNGWGGEFMLTCDLPRSMHSPALAEISHHDPHGFWWHECQLQHEHPAQ